MKKKTELDANQAAFAVFEKFLATADPQELKGKNPFAVMMGKAGGLRSAKGRKEKMTAEQRKEVARKAAAARWCKTK